MGKEAVMQVLVSVAIGTTPVVQRTDLSRTFYVCIMLGLEPVAHTS